MSLVSSSEHVIIILYCNILVLLLPLDWKLLRTSFKTTLTNFLVGEQGSLGTNSTLKDFL